MEIRHTDVRVGNIVRYSQSNAIRPSARGTIMYLKSRDIMEIEKYGDIFEPIPLTAKTMEYNISATNQHIFRSAHNKYGISFGLFIDFSNGTPFIYKQNSVGMTCDICEVPFVHTLQNCFYAFTQTELNIKL